MQHPPGRNTSIAAAHTDLQLCAAENYSEVEDLVKYALNDDVSFVTQPAELRNQRVFAIRVGVNGFLDVARTTYKEINQDVHDMTTELGEEHQLCIDLKFDPARHYYLHIPATEFEERPIPDIFVNVVRRKRVIECQTLDLMKMNQKIKDAHNEVISMSDRSIQELIEAVRSRIHPLFKISEAIGLLDMLTGFAQLATTQDYVKPELTQALAIKAGRHPIREKAQAHTHKWIPNDVYATEQNRFQIITGCNMSGKSTYIRSIALQSVMAQAGSFVPATYASFPIFRQLFARISTDSAVEANVSTFAAEMRDIAHILRNIEPHSLVIIDELGRGTSTTDGLAIAIAIAEALIESKAFVWFVTHFRDLPRILSERAGVVNLHLSVNFSTTDDDPTTTRMKMTYKVSDGPIPPSNQYYGLALARAINLPDRVIEVATLVSEELNEQNAAKKDEPRVMAMPRRRRLMLSLREQLMLAREGGLKGAELKAWLKKLQEEFLVRMEALNSDEQDIGCHQDAFTEEFTESVVGDHAMESRGDERNTVSTNTDGLTDAGSEQQDGNGTSSEAEGFVEIKREEFEGIKREKIN
jgi:DNA mismatch repair protein MSH4